MGSGPSAGRSSANMAATWRLVPWMQVSAQRCSQRSRYVWPSSGRSNQRPRRSVLFAWPTLASTLPAAPGWSTRRTDFSRRRRRVWLWASRRSIPAPPNRQGSVAGPGNLVESGPELHTELSRRRTGVHGIPWQRARRRKSAAFAPNAAEALELFSFQQFIEFQQRPCTVPCTICEWIESDDSSRPWSPWSRGAVEPWSRGAVERGVCGARGAVEEFRNAASPSLVTRLLLSPNAIRAPPGTYTFAEASILSNSCPTMPNRRPRTASHHTGPATSHRFAPSPRVNARSSQSGSAAAVAFEQIAQGVVIGDIGRPALRRRHGRVQRRVGVCQPLRPGVAEVVSVPFLSALAASSSRGTGPSQNPPSMTT